MFSGDPFPLTWLPARFQRTVSAACSGSVRRISRVSNSAFHVRKLFARTFLDQIFQVRFREMDYKRLQASFSCSTWYWKYEKGWSILKDEKGGVSRSRWKVIKMGKIGWCEMSKDMLHGPMLTDLKINKLVSLEAKLARNYDPPSYWHVWSVKLLA